MKLGLGLIMELILILMELMGHLIIFLGRSYLDTKLDKFDYKSGFSEKNSDLVGNYTMTLDNDNQSLL